MRTTIYYFSGTGNCLSIARKIATLLEDCRIVNIANVVDRSIHMDEEPSNAERIGFVFPTFAYGLPNIIREFVMKVSFSQNAYFFAITSCFGIPGSTLHQLNMLLKRQNCKLNAGFAVFDHVSSLIDDPKDLVQRFMISINRGRKPLRSSERMAEIARTIEEKSIHPIEGSSRMVNFFGTLLNTMAAGTFKTSGRFFWTMDSCNTCGTCVKVCSRHNVSIVDGKPTWGNTCELCHACIQACPQSSIQYKKLTEGKPRYRNPEVTIKDLSIR